MTRSLPYIFIALFISTAAETMEKYDINSIAMRKL